MRIPSGLFKIVKEAARHLLRRPVVGIVAAARTADGRWLLVRRSDTGGWALPGGTLEWGEDLRSAVTREVEEETGARVTALGELLGVYSAAWRDPRFHAVTVVVGATVATPSANAVNPVEILDVGLFASDELPRDLSQGFADMIANVLASRTLWE